MREEIYQTNYYSVGYRIDKQLLLSLEDIFIKYNSNAKLKLDTECSNNTIYKFDSIDECFGYFENSPYRILKMEINVSFGDRYDSNKIVLIFDNTKDANVRVKYNFDSTDDYLVLKNKVEMCLKNFKLNYRVLSIIPIIPSLLTIAFVVICIYTNNNNIIFPVNIQKAIIAIWIIGSLVATTPPFAKVKRNLFPCIEFRIGQNEYIENQHSKTRNFLIATVLIGIIVGLTVNFISGFLF